MKVIRKSPRYESMAFGLIPGHRPRPVSLAAAVADECAGPSNNVAIILGDLVEALHTKGILDTAQVLAMLDGNFEVVQ